MAPYHHSASAIYLTFRLPPNFLHFLHCYPTIAASIMMRERLHSSALSYNSVLLLDVYIVTILSCPGSKFEKCSYFHGTMGFFCIPIYIYKYNNIYIHSNAYILHCLMLWWRHWFFMRMCIIHFPAPISFHYCLLTMMILMMMTNECDRKGGGEKLFM